MITQTLCEELCKLTEEEWIVVKAVISAKYTTMHPSDEYRAALRKERQRTAGYAPEELMKRLTNLLE